MDNIGGLIFLGLVVLFIWWSYQQGRPGAIGFNAQHPPRQVVVAALQSFSGHGWTTTSQTDQTISFARTQAPGCLITGFLLLFGIIPGLLYWIAAKRTLTVSVTAQPGGGGSASMVNIAWSRNGGGRGPSLAFKELIASGAPIAVASPPAPSVLAEQVEDVTGGALSAAQLSRQPVSAEPMAIPGPAAQLAETPVTTPPAFCPSCGTRRAPETRFCGNCGSDFGGDAPTPAAGSDPQG